MLVVGLTGSIGMGKSTTANMFRELGVPVHDADAVVHQLYENQAAPLIEQAFPGTTRDGVVDRDLLRTHVVDNDDAMKRLEAIVHPLVREAETRFLKEADEAGAAYVILDIPLLFETGNDDRVDKIIVVTAPQEVQRQRVMDRPGMTAKVFEAILARQLPDARKRELADFLVDTSTGFEDARRQVAAIHDRLVAEGT